MSTDTRVIEKSDQEFKFRRYSEIFMYRDVYTVLPPPLNLPYVLYSLSMRAGRHCCSCVTAGCRGCHDGGEAARRAQQATRVLSLWRPAALASYGPRL